MSGLTESRRPFHALHDVGLIKTMTENCFFGALKELLYLYGFVIDNNPDDYLMVHYLMEAFQSVPIADSKVQLLEIQKAEMRCLLPRSLLDHGFFFWIPSA
ncbi:uncharacterized protein LOC131246061 [Magnolia sinica]|uniref:uncharacterized protein LOC131246061 n=1 Tax=Magnolia sinica TaxID=86752 RepID=UPI002657D6CF|nr:uncharacterized protein LOC131246061 [Magnolia sinica]